MWFYRFALKLLLAGGLVLLCAGLLLGVSHSFTDLLAQARLESVLHFIARFSPGVLVNTVMTGMVFIVLSGVLYWSLEIKKFIQQEL